MRFRNLFVALGLLLLGSQAFAADGFYNGSTDCTGTVSTVGRLEPGQFATWCPVSTTTQLISVRGIADCNWYTTGGETLSIDQCSAANSTYCTTPLVDADGVAWVITSADETGRFSLAAGVYEITATAAASTGRLLCTGR